MLNKYRERWDIQKFLVKLPTSNNHILELYILVSLGNNKTICTGSEWAAALARPPPRLSGDPSHSPVQTGRSCRTARSDPSRATWGQAVGIIAFVPWAPTPTPAGSLEWSLRSSVFSQCSLQCWPTLQVKQRSQNFLMDKIFKQLSEMMPGNIHLFPISFITFPRIWS